MLCHDPRKSADRSMKSETDNVALMVAEILRQQFPYHEPDWAQVAANADYCDEPVEVA